MLRSQLKNMTTMELWAEYQKDKSIEIRNEIAERNLPFVKDVAYSVSQRISMIDFELNDLVSFGVIGLLQAIERYDPTSGNKFSSFAVHRVHGSIIDELRNADWIPRWIRRKIKNVRNLIEEMEQVAGCGDVNAYQFARDRGLSVIEYNILQNNYIVSLDAEDER
jgi:RNA polymerase sigma factor FliA